MPQVRCPEEGIFFLGFPCYGDHPWCPPGLDPIISPRLNLSHSKIRRPLRWAWEFSAHPLGLDTYPPPCGTCRRVWGAQNRLSLYGEGVAVGQAITGGKFWGTNLHPKR